MYKIIGIGFLLITLGLSAYLIQSGKVMLSSQASNNGKVTVTLGPETLVYSSPTSGLPDLPYFTFMNNGTPVGLMSTQTGNFFVTNPMAKTVDNPTRIYSLQRGTDPAVFDHGGLWFSGAYEDPKTGIMHGVYHAENYTNTDNAEDKTIYSIGYVQSTDGGATWVKPNYPNNLLVTGYNEPGKVGGADAGSLIPVDINGETYLYLYYFEHTNNANTRGITVARVPLKRAAKMNAWKKYYCPPKGECGFTEPARGGHFTKIANLRGRTWLSFNKYLKQFVAVDQETILTGDYVQLKVSDDGIKFRNLGERQPLGEPKPDKSWLRVYSSLLSKNGVPGKTNRRFYLYYVTLKMDPKTGFPAKPRYLFRREVTLLDSTKPLTASTSDED